MGWLERLHKENKELSRVGQFPAYQHFMFFGNKNDEESGLPEVWYANGIENIKWLDSNKERVDTVYNFPKLTDKVVIFCGMSPSIRKYWKHLVGLEDRFVIVATNSSAKYLLDRGVKLDYVIAIDGKPGAWTMDLGKKSESITGIFSAFVEPTALRQWQGKIAIVPYGVKKRDLKAKVERRWGKSLPSGGNALNSAVAIFFQCTNAKIFLFMGNELSFKKKYYADRPNPNDDVGYVYTKDIFGNKVKTLIPLFEYKIWLENMAAQLWPEYHFCNCSEGILGVEIGGDLMPCIGQKSIDVAIGDIRDAFKVEMDSHNEQYKVIYDHFYEQRFGNNSRGEGIWKYVEKYFGVTKGIDVGCGYANGVNMMRNMGYDVYGSDLADARKSWDGIGVGDFCRTEPAHKMSWEDGEFDMVVCSEVMEHIPEEMTMDTLKEIARIGSDKFLFTINLQPEKIKIAGYVQTHINLHEPDWWLEKLYEAGMEPMFYGTNEDGDDITVIAVKDAETYRNGKPFSKFGDNFPMCVIGGVPVDGLGGEEFAL
jgi:hypothetical protein